MILQLLKDESSEVRLNVVSRLDVIVSVVGIEHLSAALLPAVVALTEDPQWRVRQTIIDYIPDLASHLGQAFFADRLAPLALSALGDAVFEVRKSSVSAVRRLIGIFGIDWTINSLLPVILDPLAGNRNYLRRQTALLLISETASVLDVSTLQSVYGPILETLSKDPVPNVRLSVAKCLREVVPLVSASDSSDFFLQGSVVPMLQALDRDSDTDVHHEAFLALRLVPS